MVVKNFQKMAVISVVLFATLLFTHARSSSGQISSRRVSSQGSVVVSTNAKRSSSPVSLPVSPSLSLQPTGPDTSSLSVSSHKTSLVSPTRSVNVQTSVVTVQTSVVIGQTSIVTGQTSTVSGQTSSVTVQTSVVTGQTSTVSGQTNTVAVQTTAVTGQSSTVTGQTSKVSGQTSTVSGQTSTVSGQTSTVALQTSVVAGQTSIVSGQSSTVTDQVNIVSGQTNTIDVSPTRASPGVSASVPTDVNPCKRNNGGCAHYCTRLNREYNCSCSSGFKLNADRHTCTGIIGESPYHGTISLIL
ncbi:integumentary mucin A.1-like [Pocillopora damicornis]|uniref:integumentary mucin A.1-like n=1 Tax=Pocillopora damicornis TaxID=46731 RepID=UPI000F551B65|nr:integumentary mucin A.1-like [Pocillopora damicornis]